MYAQGLNWIIDCIDQYSQNSSVCSHFVTGCACRFDNMKLFMNRNITESFYIKLCKLIAYGLTKKLIAILILLNCC